MEEGTRVYFQRARKEQRKCRNKQFLFNSKGEGDIEGREKDEKVELKPNFGKTKLGGGGRGRWEKRVNLTLAPKQGGSARKKGQ